MKDTKPTYWLLGDNLQRYTSFTSYAWGSLSKCWLKTSKRLKGEIRITKAQATKRFPEAFKEGVKFEQ